MIPRPRPMILAAMLAAMCCLLPSAGAESFWTSTEESFLKTPVSVFQTGLDAAAGHLDKFDTKPIRTRDIDSVFGNRQARTQLAQQANDVAGHAAAWSKKLKLPLLSSGLQVVETGISASVRFCSGDIAGSAAEVLNEGAKGALVSGITAWSAAKAGALAGSTFGPVGTVAGGAVGAAGAAIVASGGYDALLGDYFQRAADYMSERTKESYIEEARESRREHLAREEAHRREHLAREEARRREKELAIEEARRNRAAHLEQQARTEAPDASRPVIPSDCTLHITGWNPEYPEIKADFVFHIRDNEVTSRIKNPTPDGVRNWQEDTTFTGRLEDNVIRGRWRGVLSWEVDLPYGPIGTHRNQSSSEVVMTLNVDGSLHGKATSSGVSTSTWRNKGDNHLPDSQNSWGPRTDPLAGRWKLGGGK